MPHSYLMATERYLSEVNAPRLNPSQTGWHSIYLSGWDKRLSWSLWLVIYQDGLPLCRQPLI